MKARIRIMKKTDFLDAVGRIDPKHIALGLPDASHSPKKKASALATRLIAACAGLLIIVSAICAVSLLTGPNVLYVNGFYIEDGVLTGYDGTETALILPEEVEAIGDRVFLANEHVNEIESIQIGANVRTVAPDAFAGLPETVILSIDQANTAIVEQDGLLITADGTTLLKYMREGEAAYQIPDTVRHIAAHAFQSTPLETVVFNEGLLSIGYNAFAGCYSLRAIHLPDSVEAIGEGAFAHCTGAVDGTVPPTAEIGANAFDAVPFYLSLQAGHTAPLEEIKRGVITPSEAIAKSNNYALTKQIRYILSVLAGEPYEPDDIEKMAYAAATSSPVIPEGTVFPDAFTIEDLTFSDSGWGGSGIYDVQISLKTGDSTLTMAAYGYNTDQALAWEDVLFRISALFFTKDPSSAAPEDQVKDFGWTAVFERDGEMYSAITWTHEDGTVIHNTIVNAVSSTPYVITFSPDGTRAAIEYTSIGSGRPTFYIQSLNGDKLHAGIYDYQEYLSRYFGAYVPGTLSFADNDTVLGENEHGRFSLNIYEAEPVQLDLDPALSDPNNKETVEVALPLPVFPDATLYMQLPEVWMERSSYYDDLVRKAAGLEPNRAFVFTRDNGLPVYLCRNLPEEGFVTTDSGVNYYLTREELNGSVFPAVDYHYSIRYRGEIQCCITVRVYRDDAPGYAEEILSALVDSFRIEED